MPNFILAAMFPIFFDYSFTSPSYCFGLFFYLVAIFFWTDHRSSTKIMWRLPLNIVLAIFVVTTKVSNLPTVLAGLACIAGYGLFRQKAWARISLINFLTTSSTFFVYFLFLEPLMLLCLHSVHQSKKPSNVYIYLHIVTIYS